jgi:AbrB family looped-hinge helix DNA binding protein
MNTVTVSPKFQVVIPLAVREELGLSVGEKMRVIRYNDRIELIPVKPIKSLRGFLKGIDTSIDREGDRL